MTKISLKIVTPERVVYEDVVDSVTTMTESGEITVLPNHVPLVTNLRSGEIRLKKDKEEIFLAASTGFLEVRSGREVVILADTAERAEELELEKIEEAKERARQALTDVRHTDDVSFANAAAALERELARHKVALKRKHRTMIAPKSE
ncbi:ATP synthase F1 subunit epsilon [Candidatus Uhrbacteria bacterium RIFOXYB12_FULL_58_10]|uniref:ATP synthase epsilon chain n=1 Tax=Candidatus Uhrbacteria bacterium RIFOXYB2_FULL_57_15 TaxID=1802422 RepID=A0A1F7W726_9BACT|nr:MAG: ATP synthase F1 subunit epsilon [Candidatus Uhrbacteria bacterium RIFOXYB12_FULL_58_10]OGL98178.1 MAG: ATP synthase F1 subunit epsilon [Candidatus Uhrbacteria bacterium RIFOXYB2_FULL_57_15]OGL99331.1 MAG: ATP synthase F1 subunit epsilon [Candidatus Uhrbacteria bacterium RIFOXYC12_FULL_57_11]